MEIKKTVCNITFQSSNYINFGFWDGSTLKGAIKQALIEHSEDDIAKRLFETSVTGDAHLVSNPFTIDSKFRASEAVGKRLNFKITLYGDTCDYIEKIKKAIKTINYTSYFDDKPYEMKLINFEVASEEVVDLNKIYEVAEDKTNTAIRIVFETPFVNQNFQDRMVEAFIRSCTTRVTGMVNGLGIDHTVKFQEFIDAHSGIEVAYSNLDFRTSWGRFSTRTNKNHRVYGALGEMVLAGDLSKVYNLIKVVEKLGIGKSTLMGFGKFHVEELEGT